MNVGIIRHTLAGVTASLNCDLPSTLTTRRYYCGLGAPHYPMPAIRMDVGIHPLFVDICEYRYHDKRSPQHWRRTSEWLKD